MSTNNNRRGPPPERRAANSVISLTQFAHAKSKGTRRAIEKYKNKKQSKFNRNAGLLREYRKVMKNEGYDAGKGGSRKRNRASDGDGDNNYGNDDTRDIGNDQGNNGNNNDDQKRKKRRHKSDPLAKAKEMAKRSKEEKEQRKEMRAKEIKENERKMKQKKARAKKMRKRTNRGQPIMKNMVGDLLEKIRNTAE